jgi:hypothetical protein
MENDGRLASPAEPGEPGKGLVLMEDKNRFGYRKTDTEILQEDSDKSSLIKHLEELPFHEQEYYYNAFISEQKNKALFHPSEPSDKQFCSVLDEMVEIQKAINKQESDICDIMSTPAGARLLDWSYIVRGTWWYRLFSMIDGTFKKRIARLS